MKNENAIEIDTDAAADFIFIFHFPFFISILFFSFIYATDGFGSNDDFNDTFRTASGGVQGGWAPLENKNGFWLFETLRFWPYLSSS